MKLSVLIPCLFPVLLYSQAPVWSSFTDSTVTYSSPRAVDLTNDGIKDIVIGAGKEAQATNFGVLAFNGLNGAPLWNVPVKNEIFASAQFKDVNNDAIPDVFVGGRDAQLYAINGSNGNIIWKFFPYSNLNPRDSGWYNFYSVQFIPDMNNDSVPDLLVANGGDHSAPVWQNNRPPGHLMVIDATNGSILAKAVMPDSAETYCSPVVVDAKGNGVLYVIFGTGGETLGGSMWAAELVNDLMSNDLSNAVPLVTNPSKGFVAPASLGKFANDASTDIIVQGFDGTVYRFYGGNFSLKWSVSFPGTESSAAPTLGNFTGGIKPDVFTVLYKGTAPSYSDYYQVMLDGSNGNVIYKDSIGFMHFVSANAFDSNADGVDEVLISINENQGSFKHQLKLINFQTNSTINLSNLESGCNIGSTPCICDLNNDNLLDIVYAYRADSLNPMGWKGMYVKRISTAYQVPNNGIAWGNYMGTFYDGYHQSNSIDCGSGSILAGLSTTNPTCNGLSNGSVVPNTANGIAPFTFSWSNGSVDSILTNVGAGTYSLTVTDSSGCFETAVVNINDPYTISFGGQINPTCEGSTNGQITVSSSGCYCMFSGCTFQWSNGTSGYTASGLSAGNYSVTITHANGCVVTPVVSIPNGLPVIAASIIDNVNCHGGSDGSIQLIPSYSGVNYLWNTGSNDSTIHLIAAGNYSVSVSDNRPCYDTLFFSVSQPTPLSVALSSLPETSIGMNDGSASAIVTGGISPYTFLWNDSLNQNGSTATQLGTGWFSVLVTDSNSCSTIDSVLVSHTTSVNDLAKNNFISIFPNPIERNSQIQLSGLNRDAKVIISNSMGVEIETHITKNKELKISTQNFIPGLYIITVFNSQDEKKVYKIIVE